MFFKVLSGRQYQQILDEAERLRNQCDQLERNLRALERQNKDIEERHKRDTAELHTELATLRQTAQDFEALQQQISEDIEGVAKELGISRIQIQNLWGDRSELIEMYVDQLYALAKRFAQTNTGMRKNRGLFLVLVDCRNMVSTNFSEFHDGQTEELSRTEYQGINQLPHIFSTKINEVFQYMGEKVILKDENGVITGQAERDGALLIDLRGVAFRSRVMVEGVRTHRVYDRVERLRHGSAKHNAAIYASSLDEVMAALVVSEETSEVTIFRDGRFIKSYAPYTDTETHRSEQVIPVASEDGSVTLMENGNREDVILENGNPQSPVPQFHAG